MKKRKLQMVSFILAVMFGFTGCDRFGKDVIWEMQEDGHQQLTESEGSSEAVIEENSESGTGKDDVMTADMDNTESAVLLYADICGAVNDPGVYELEEGSRICDLVRMAGGLTEDADLTAINQAERVTDGIKVRVYTKEEAAELPVQMNTGQMITGENDSDNRININSADQNQLMTLSGIGESRAADIIAYRTEHGSFQTIDEIMNVSGIKESTFQKIKDQIVVE